MSWLEVETKAGIKDIKALRKRIRKIAVFVKKEKRKDEYFSLKRKGYPRKAFRVRYDGRKYIVNFKKWLKELYSKDIVVKEEFEFELSNKEHFDHFLALLKDLGFKNWIKKIKDVESYKYRKDKKLVIEFNKVRHLGYFIEIEYLCQKKDLKKAKAKIRQVLKELEIKQSQINNTGYTKMLYDKGISLREL